MANGNGKNGKKNDCRQKGVVPHQLKAHLFKPGNPGPGPRKRPRTVTEHLKRMLPETVRRRMEDGTVVEMPRAQAIAHILAGQVLRGPDPETANDGNWQFATRQLLDRVDPVPRETPLLAVNVQQEHTQVAIGFCEQIRQKTGRQDITHSDVLEAIESRAFGGGNGRKGGSSGQ